MGRPLETDRSPAEPLYPILGHRSTLGQLLVSMQNEAMVQSINTARHRSDVKGGGKTYRWGVDVQRKCQVNGPAIMSVVAVSSQ